MGHIYAEKNDFSPIWCSSSNECPVLLFPKSSSQSYSFVESVLLIQSYLTLCNLVKYSPPGSSLHGIFQARVLEWIAISSSKGSSPPRDRTWVSCIGRWILYHLSYEGSFTRNSCSCEGNKQNTFLDTFRAIWEEIEVVLNFHQMWQNTILLSETWVTLSSFTHKKMHGQN